MYLFFDTETTGLPRNWRAPVSDLNNWPRMVQLAWLEYDHTANLLKSVDYIIKPEGYHIPTDASRIHGITTERALAEGISMQKALAEFSEAVRNADMLVAHNMSFDEKIVGAEFLRNNFENILVKKKRTCTMEAGTNYCRLPGSYGNYKWPKLSELHYKLFKTNFEDAHNAAVDIKITAKCFWEMSKLGLF